MQLKRAVAAIAVKRNLQRTGIVVSFCPRQMLISMVKALSPFRTE
jgi:hypothetical protein